MRYLLFLCIILLHAPNIAAQKTSTWDRDVLQIIESFQQDDRVALQVGILFKDDSFVRSFGKANIAYDQALENHHSILSTDIANLFVSYAILHMEQKDKLDLDDPISKYLDQLPSYLNSIAIIDLLTHAHHAPNWMSYQWLAGWKYNDFRSQDQLIEQLHRIPHWPDREDGFAYNSMGYILAAMIVEKLSGQPFEVYVKQEIFDPLGMKNSYFQSNPDQVVVGQVSEYYQNNGHYFLDKYPYHQCTANRLYLSIEDFVIWSKHLHGKTSIQEKTVQRLKAIKRNFPNIDYQIGPGSFWDEQGGLTRMMQNGLAYGNKAFSCYFFDQDLSILVLSNSSQFPARSMATEIAYKLLQDVMVENESDANPTQTLIPKTYAGIELEKYTGHFWNATNFQSREIRIRNDSLYYFINEQRFYPLIPLDEERFFALQGQNQIVFDFSAHRDSLIISVDDAYSYLYSSYEPFQMDRENNHPYLGLYYSAVLDAHYRVDQDDQGIFLKNNRSDKIYLQSIMQDQFLCDEWYIGLVQFIRDNQQVDGFEVHFGSSPPCSFEKVQ